MDFIVPAGWAGVCQGGGRRVLGLRGSCGAHPTGILGGMLSRRGRVSMCKTVWNMLTPLARREHATRPPGGPLARGY